jgi:hypothetical protein
VTDIAGGITICVGRRRHRLSQIKTGMVLFPDKDLASPPGTNSQSEVLE